MGVFVLPTAQGSDVFTAAPQSTIHITEKMVLLLQPLPLYPASLNCCPAQLPNLPGSVISFWSKQGWYTPKPKSRKMQRAGKQPKSFTPVLREPGLFCVPFHTGNLNRSSAAFWRQHQQVLCPSTAVPWHPSVKHWPCPQPAFSRTLN